MQNIKDFSLSWQGFAEIEDPKGARDQFSDGMKSDVHFLQKNWISVGVGSNATHRVPPCFLFMRESESMQMELL